VFKKLALKFLESKVSKGYMTSAGLVTLVASVVNARYGVDIGPDLTLVVQGVSAAVVLFGKMRAVYQAGK
jgi:hypothetical protein